MAHALQIDTLAFSKKLREAGADERLAGAIVEGITAADTSELATKSDLGEVKAEVKAEIADVKTELKAEIAGLDVKIGDVKTELKAEIADVKADVRAVTDKLGTMATKAELGDVKADILKWMFGAIIAQTGIILAVVKLL